MVNFYDESYIYYLFVVYLLKSYFFAYSLLTTFTQYKKCFPLIYNTSYFCEEKYFALWDNEMGNSGQIYASKKGLSRAQIFADF